MLNTLKNTLADRFAKTGLRMPSVAANAGVQRLLVPLLLTAAILTALVVTVLWKTSDSFKPVFGARENVVVSDVVGTLEAEGLRYRLHPESGQVLVAESDLAQARMLLAAKGVAAKLPEGLELMDRNDPLGVSQFVQDVRFRRGLEGELARSIATLDVVHAARVHLSIARSSSFVVNTGDKSSASVVLQLKPGQNLQREQIAAIIQMVSSSVAGLSPTQVAVTDQAGNFLSARVDMAEGFDPLSSDDQASRVTEELRRNANELLNATLGASHFRVTITADVSQDKTEETYEQYSGDPRVLSEATREENDRSKGVALGIPGSLSNRPVNAASQDEKGKDDNGNFRAAVSRNYGYDRSVVQVKRAKGRLSKLHVAVVLDDAVAPSGEGGWKPADMERIEKLLTVGLGVDSLRGDQLAVSSMPFLAAPELPAWWQDPAQWYEWIVTALWAIGGIALLVILSRLVAALGRASKQIAAEAPETTTPAALANAAPGTAPVASIGTAGVAAPERGLPADKAVQMSMVPLLENVDLPPPGSEVDVMVEHLRTLAAKEPERVAEVVKQWVQKHSQPAGAES